MITGLRHVATILFGKLLNSLLNLTMENVKIIKFGIFSIWKSFEPPKKNWPRKHVRKKWINDYFRLGVFGQSKSPFYNAKLIWWDTREKTCIWCLLDNKFGFVSFGKSWVSKSVIFHCISPHILIWYNNVNLLCCQLQFFWIL